MRYDFANISLLSLQKISTYNQDTVIYIGDEVVVKFNKSMPLQKHYNLINTIYSLNFLSVDVPELVAHSNLENVSIFVFKVLRGLRDFDVTLSEDFEFLARFLANFYRETKGLQTNSSCIFKKEVLSRNVGDFLLSVYRSSFQRVKYVEKQRSRVVLRDVNPTNFKYVDNKLFLIDLDEIQMGEIEQDLAYVFLKFNDKVRFNLEFVQRYKIILRELREFRVDVDRIISYVVLIKINKITDKNKNYDLSEITAYVSWLLRNRRRIVEILSV